MTDHSTLLAKLDAQARFSREDGPIGLAELLIQARDSIMELQDEVNKLGTCKLCGNSVSFPRCKNCPTGYVRAGSEDDE